jgi:hypothetical protein
MEVKLIEKDLLQLLEDNKEIINGHERVKAVKN